jgi:hypothetical protein
LIQHLKNNHILADRHESFAQALGLSSGSVPSPDERLKVVIERLTRNKKNRPKRKKTLLSQINAYFGKQLSEDQLTQIVDAVIARNLVEITPRGAVVYKI